MWTPRKDPTVLSAVVHISHGNDDFKLRGACLYCRKKKWKLIKELIEEKKIGKNPLLRWNKDPYNVLQFGAA